LEDWSGYPDVDALRAAYSINDGWAAGNDLALSPHGDSATLAYTIVSADPNADYQLSVMTCAKRSYKDGGQIYANLSDSFYCNPAYDALYAKQATQADEAQRAQTVKQMQQMVYDDAPYAVLYYYNDLQAYSDKWTNFVEQPADGGVVLFQYGAWSYTKIDLTSRVGAEAAASATDTGSGGGTMLVWVILAVILVLGALFGGLWFSRRRGGDRMDVE